MLRDAVRFVNFWKKLFLINTPFLLFFVYLLATVECHEKYAKNGFSLYFREIIAVKKLTKGIVSLSLEPQHHTSGD